MYVLCIKEFSEKNIGSHLRHCRHIFAMLCNQVIQGVDHHVSHTPPAADCSHGDLWFALCQGNQRLEKLGTDMLQIALLAQEVFNK